MLKKCGLNIRLLCSGQERVAGQLEGLQPHLQVLSSTASAIDKKVEQLSRYKGSSPIFKSSLPQPLPLTRKLSSYQGIRDSCPTSRSSPQQPLPLTRKLSRSPGIRESSPTSRSSPPQPLPLQESKAAVQEKGIPVSPTAPLLGHSLCH